MDLTEIDWVRGLGNKYFSVSHWKIMKLSGFSGLIFQSFWDNMMILSFFGIYITKWIKPSAAGLCFRALNSKNGFLWACLLLSAVILPVRVIHYFWWYGTRRREWFSHRWHFSSKYLSPPSTTLCSNDKLCPVTTLYWIKPLTRCGGVHVFYPSTQEEEAVRYFSLRPS